MPEVERGGWEMRWETAELRASMAIAGDATDARVRVSMVPTGIVGCWISPWGLQPFREREHALNLGLYTTQEDHKSLMLLSINMREIQESRKRKLNYVVAHKMKGLRAWLWGFKNHDAAFSTFWVGDPFGGSSSGRHCHLSSSSFWSTPELFSQQSKCSKVISNLFVQSGREMIWFHSTLESGPSQPPYSSPIVHNVWTLDHLLSGALFCQLHSIFPVVMSLVIEEKMKKNLCTKCSRCS